MKQDHRHETFALAAVVRVVFADFEELGHKVPKHALQAFAAVESWLRGDDVSTDALQAAADLSHEDGVPFEKREKERPLTWARGAAGNLAWFAKKDRGWQNAHKSVMDAAFYTLSSLRIPGTKDDTALEAVRKAALKEAAKLPKVAAKKIQKVKTPKADFTALIGTAAMKRLAKRKPVFDAKMRGNETELKALLQQKNYPVHASVIAYDEHYGGLVLADAPGEEGYDWLFGAHACLMSDAHQNPRGDKPSWVPVAYSPKDGIFFMDEKGIVWAIDTISDTEATHYAENGDTMMKQLLTEE